MTLPTSPPPDPAATRTRSWAPRRGETALAGAGGLVMVGLGFTVDPTGRWLVWAAAVLLFGIAAMDLVVRPRLQADDTGVTVRSATGRKSAPWPQVEVGVRRLQRLGRTVPTLELDLDEDLVVLGRRELGADPEVVAQDLAALQTAP